MEERSTGFMGGMFGSQEEHKDELPFGREDGMQKAQSDNAEREYKEISLKFGRGCVGNTFEGKDGNTYTEIKIPNPDKDDHRPWQSFVVKENHLHENKFGKGMWIKLPEEGHTTLRRNVKVGKDEQGKDIWDVEKTKVSNKELKKLVEAYKDRDRDKDHDRSSMKEMLAEKKTEVAKQEHSSRPHSRAMEAAL